MPVPLRAALRWRRRGRTRWLPAAVQGRAGSPRRGGVSFPPSAARAGRGVAPPGLLRLAGSSDDSPRIERLAVSYPLIQEAPCP
jgi:hypothetical protein